MFLRNSTKQSLYKQAKNIVLTNQSLTRKMVKYYLDNKDYKQQQKYRDIFFIFVAVVIGIIFGLVAGFFIVSSGGELQNFLFSNGKYAVLILGIPLFLFIVYFIQLKIKAYFGWLNKEDTYYILSENVYGIVVSQKHLRKNDKK